MDAVNEAFEANVDASGYMDRGEPKADIVGYSDFIDELKFKIQAIFEANDVPMLDTHFFKAGKHNKNWCECGKYMTHPIHFRNNP